MHVFTRTIYKGTFLAIVILLALVHFSTLMAQGDLQLLKKRVVFEGTQRIEQLHVTNTGKDTAVYAITFVNNRMTEVGAFESITEPDPGQYFADQNIRIYPRRVTLAPGETQAVKLQVTKANQLAPGEYRSHLYFRAEPGKKPLGEENKDAAAEKAGISMKLIPIFGISIPVIIRIGEPTAKVTISDLALVKQDNVSYQLNLKFNRTGNMSVYGDIDVQHISPKGEKTEVGIVKGFSVYSPNTARTFQMQLIKPANIDFKSGKLLVTYKPQGSEKLVKLADAELVLTPKSLASNRP